MATSGSTNFDMTRAEISQRALRMMGALGQGQTMTAAMSSEANTELNALVKTLQTEGVRLWTRDWITKTLAASSEVTGTDALIYTCGKSHTSAAATKPITGAGYSTNWYQSGSTGGVWVTATAYVSIGDFTLDTEYLGVEKAFVRDDETDTDLEIIPFTDYLSLTDKTDTGAPTKFSIDNAYSTQRCFLWPMPDATDYVIHMLAIKKLEDFDTAADNPDFPVRWLDVLTYGLAHNLGLYYGVPSVDRFFNLYQLALAKAKRDDSENATRFMVGAF